MPTERPIKSCLQFPAAICSARCLLGFGLVDTEGARLMAVFAELIVLFDLRLFRMHREMRCLVRVFLGSKVYLITWRGEEN